MNGKFSAKVRGWSDRQKENLGLIFTGAVRDLIEDAQMPVSKGGRMPVDTGHLRDSLVVETSTSGAALSASLSVGNWKLGSSVRIAWTAEYARHVEYGSQGRPGRFFMRGAAQKWPQFVAENAARYR